MSYFVIPITFCNLFATLCNNYWINRDPRHGTRDLGPWIEDPGPRNKDLRLEIKASGFRTWNPGSRNQDREPRPMTWSLTKVYVLYYQFNIDIKNFWFNERKSRFSFSRANSQVIKWGSESKGVRQNNCK